MTLRYAVGIRIRNKPDQITVDAEDALIAIHTPIRADGNPLPMLSE